MAGKLYVDEIRNTATTGSPLFPNGLDVTELIDPIGSEGDVLTVQADGTILAAAAAGAGIPIMVSGITDLSDAAAVGAAVLAALTPLTWQTPYAIEFYVSKTDGTGLTILLAYDSGGLAWIYEPGNLGGASGAGSVLFWGMRWFDNS